MAAFKQNPDFDIDPDNFLPVPEMEIEEDDNKPEYKALRLKIRRLRFHEPESGFFIAVGEAVGRIPSLPDDLVEHGQPVRNQISIKGTSASFIDNTNLNEELDLVGEWELNGKHGLQFDVKYIKAAIPMTLTGLERYLSCGQLKWIGEVTAKAIVDRWGLDAIRIIDHTPQKLTEISGITQARATDIAEAWVKNRDFIELVGFLGEYGINETLAMKIRDEFDGVDLAKRIKANPYMLTQVSGISFLSADKLALSLGFKKDSPFRFIAALEHTLNEKMNEEGHTAIPVSEWIDTSATYLRQSRDVVKQKCQELLKEKKVVVRKLKVLDRQGKINVISCVSPFKVGKVEYDVANELKRLGSSFQPLSSTDENTVIEVIEDPARNLDPSQKDAVWNAFQFPIGVLTGGPGTGKTTTLKSIVFAARQMGYQVVLAAPTGRAAKRMEEAILQEAKTMHRHLGFARGEFLHNKSNAMAGTFFVVDESSMVDVNMALSWLEAVPSGARILFVGDADQLPSVGMGDVLRDFIESQKIPVSRLTKVHRQAEGSDISFNAHAINNGNMPNIRGDKWTDDFFFVSADSNAAIRNELVELIQGMLNQGISPRDIQILCPQKNKDCGTVAINQLVRGLLNPFHPTNEDLEAPICLGERMMQTKNDYELEVYNGDMGTVVEINKESKQMWLEMEDGRTVEYPKNKQSKLIYAYASTVHKSQGGERPYVLMLVTREHRMTLSKSSIYTAVTRGKKRVGVIGESRVLNQAIKTKNQKRRITGLVEEMERIKLDLGYRHQA